MQETNSDSAPRRSILKWVLDIAMAITFTLLLNARVLGGLSFHETAGAVIGLVFGVHVFLNWSWVVGTTLRFFRNPLPGRIRFGYLLNWLLLVAMAVIILSGFLISRVLIPGMRVPNGRWIQGIHITMGFLVLAVVGCHLGMHWGWVGSTTRRLLQQYPRTLSLGAAMVVLLLAGGQAMRTPAEPSTSRSETEIKNDMHPSNRSGVRGERRDDGNRRGRDPKRGEGQHGRGRGFGASNVWGVLGFYLGLLTLFAFLTVLVERWIERRASAVK